MEKRFTLSVFTENRVGILNRITIIFTRRHLNIDSLTVSETEVKGVSRYTIVLHATREKLDKVAGQISKLVDVLATFVYTDEDMVHQEIALYKIKNDAILSTELEKVIRENHARVLAVDPEFVVIEKTGHSEETTQLFDRLQPFGILEFARSGSVALTKSTNQFSLYLKELEAQQ